MKKIGFIIYGNLDRISGGYLYDRKVVEYLKNHGLNVCAIGIPQRSYLLNILWNFLFIFLFAKKEFDILIEDEMTYPSLFLFNFWLKWKKETKIVTIVHLLQWIEIRDHWYCSLVKGMEKLMLKSADLIIANSEHTKGGIVEMGIPQKVIEVVYPGFDLPFLPAAKRQEAGERVKLLFVANCIERKGLNILIEALSSLRNPLLFLDVVGNDAIEPLYFQKVKRKVERYGLRDRVTFWGKVAWEEVGKFYVNADIFVVPSFYEPYGMVFAEAMSFGLPIIATNIGGILEIVKDKKNGILVPPGDVNALARAIDTFSRNRYLRELYGKEGYERSKGFASWNETGSLIFSLLTGSS